MKNDRPWDPPNQPSSEGSDESIAILLAMADWKAPITRSELAALTNLDGHIVSNVLQALKTRGLVTLHSTASNNTWRIVARTGTPA